MKQIQPITNDHIIRIPFSMKLQEISQATMASDASYVLSTTKSFNDREFVSKKTKTAGIELAPTTFLPSESQQ